MLSDENAALQLAFYELLEGRIPSRMPVHGRDSEHVKREDRITHTNALYGVQPKWSETSLSFTLKFRELQYVQ